MRRQETTGHELGAVTVELEMYNLYYTCTMKLKRRAYSISMQHLLAWGKKKFRDGTRRNIRKCDCYLNILHGNCIMLPRVAYAARFGSLIMLSKATSLNARFKEFTLSRTNGLVSWVIHDSMIICNRSIVLNFTGSKGPSICAMLGVESDHR